MPEVGKRSQKLSHGKLSHRERDHPGAPADCFSHISARWSGRLTCDVLVSVAIGVPGTVYIGVCTVCLDDASSIKWALFYFDLCV